MSVTALYQVYRDNQTEDFPVVFSAPCRSECARWLQDNWHHYSDELRVTYNPWALVAV